MRIKMWKTKIQMVEIKDLYKSLTLSITFDSIEDFEKFKFDLIFDIQATLDDSYGLNIYNRDTKDYENRYILLKAIPMDDAIRYLEILIDDASYVGKRVCDMKSVVRGIEQSEYYEDVERYELNGSEIVKLRTMREKLLELYSYSS
jgi:hypothetical protein